MHEVNNEELQFLTAISAYKTTFTYADSILGYCSLKKISKEQFLHEAIVDRLNKETKASPAIQGMFNKREVCKLDDIHDKKVAATLKKHAKRYSNIARMLIADANKHPSGWATTQSTLSEDYGLGIYQLRGILDILKQNNLVEVAYGTRSITIQVNPDSAWQNEFDFFKAISEV